MKIFKKKSLNQNTESTFKNKKGKNFLFSEIEKYCDMPFELVNKKFITKESDFLSSRRLIGDDKYVTLYTFTTSLPREFWFREDEVSRFIKSTQEYWDGLIENRINENSSELMTRTESNIQNGLRYFTNQLITDNLKYYWEKGNNLQKLSESKSISQKLYDKLYTENTKMLDKIKQICFYNISAEESKKIMKELINDWEREKNRNDLDFSTSSIK